MEDPDMAQTNKVLDGIIRGRRSCRVFTAEVPSKDLVTQVLDAGMHGPFAALAVAGRADFRRFFVIEGGGEAMGRLREIVRRHMLEATARMEEQAAQDAVFAAPTAAFRAVLKRATFPQCPWLVLVAELNGFPDVAPQSLAHCLQNMWLKATALGMGVQLLSVFEMMSENEELLALLGLTPGAYSLLGCAIGYPAAPLGLSERPDTAAATTWLR